MTSFSATPPGRLQSTNRISSAGMLPEYFIHSSFSCLYLCVYSRNYSTIYLVKTLLAQNKNQIYIKGKPTFFIFKKCPKCIFEDSLWVSFTGELPDDGCEAVEGDVAGSIVHLVDDVHHLLLGGIVARPPQRPHNTLQLMECRLETKSNICTTIIFKCEILYLHLQLWFWYYSNQNDRKLP